jgi:SAGA-associated factor 73
VASEDESTIKVAPTKKGSKEKSNGIIKLKRPAPKHNKPGNWHDGSVVEGRVFLDI